MASFYEIQEQGLLWRNKFEKCSEEQLQQSAQLNAELDQERAAMKQLEVQHASAIEQKERERLEVQSLMDQERAAASLKEQQLNSAIEEKDRERLELQVLLDQKVQQQSEGVCKNFHEMLLDNYVPIQKNFVEKGQGKALVWECAGHGQCGGLGDRTRGIITTFVQAVLTDRAFLISHTTPVELEDYLGFMPEAKTSWKYSAANISESATRSSENNINKHGEAVKRYQTVDFNSEFKQIHHINTNLPIQMYLLLNPYLEKKVRLYGLDKVNYIDLNSCIFEFLLSPRGKLLDALEKYKPVLEENYVIGIQVRTGGNGATWTDPPILSLNATSYFWGCAERYEKQFLDIDPTKPVKWFLTTDSSSVRDEALKRFPQKVIQTEGEQVHIDRSDPEKAANGFLKTILDMYLLSEAHKLVISRSNFAELAALRNRHRAFMYPIDCKEGKEKSDFTRWIPDLW